MGKPPQWHSDTPTSKRRNYGLSRVFNGKTSRRDGSSWSFQRSIRLDSARLHGQTILVWRIHAIYVRFMLAYLTRDSLWVPIIRATIDQSLRARQTVSSAIPGLPSISIGPRSPPKSQQLHALANLFARNKRVRCPFLEDADHPWKLYLPPIRPINGPPPWLGHQHVLCTAFLLDDGGLFVGFNSRSHDVNDAKTRPHEHFN